MIKSFYVINEDNGEFLPYNVMPYFIDCYEAVKDTDRCPKTFDEFKEFIERRSTYMYWSRCEYEIILSDWPRQKVSEKWDIHKQILMNLDLITKLLMKIVKNGN